jgi:hypothetical protein
MRIIRSILLALLFSLLFGLAVGTWLRVKLEKTPVYIGALEHQDEVGTRNSRVVFSPPGYPPARLTV